MAIDPLVTVIIATYNSRGTLALTLNSVLNQDWTDFEVWIVGDECTDNSAEVVSAFNDPRLNWVNLPKNTGSQSEPNNEGLRRARGQYIAYLGHDDLWLPWHLSTLIAHLQATSADLVHSLCVMIAPAGVFDAIGLPRDGVNYDLHTIVPSTWLHRLEVAGAIGGWRDPHSISRAADFDFTRRAFVAGRRIEFAPVLSVLKFGSAWWKSYVRTGDPPQAAYLQALLKDPIAVRDQVLFDMAVAYTRYYRSVGKVSVRINLREVYRDLHRLAGSIGRAAIDKFGRERFPLKRLLIVLQSRNVRKLRRARGLPPLK
ncbi:MAG TPA: glycosyltransferase [Anaerolineae bacterium]|nr:glycosyltransferase [Anaerolineae bacterium]